jgi:hypothetical protein
VHISSPHRIRRPEVIAHQLPRPAPNELANYFGVSIARPALAIIESAAILRQGDLAVALDSLLQRGTLTLPSLERAVEAHKRFPGNANLRQLVEDRLNGSGLLRSFFEYQLDVVLRRYGLPIPVSNFAVRLPNGRRRVLDKAWPDLYVGLEAESWAHHSNTTDWGRSRVRDRELTGLGWTVVAAVVEDVRRPERLIQDLRLVLDRRRNLG